MLVDSLAVEEQQANLVTCYVPDLEVDIIEPLQAVGYNHQQIQELDEVSF